MDTATEKRDRARHYRYIASQVTDPSASQAIRHLAEKLETEAEESERPASRNDAERQDGSGERAPR